MLSRIRCTFLLSSALALVSGACTDLDDNESVGSQETVGSGAAGKILASSSLGLAEIEVKWGGYTSKVEGPTRLVMQEIVIQPGGHSGWHTHGGMAFASIVEGALTLYSSKAPCAGTTYPAGTAFVDPGFGNVHIARNEGTTPMTVRVQYVQPEGSAVRVDVPAPAGACF